ncbi:MAG TPA: chitobiase/beta-hexosaminidase C-terminal domain-containing protein, partial [Cyclobacteriaceae bacterium]
PQPVTVPVGGIATFVVGASGNAPLTIQWQRNNVNIPGATSYIYEITSATLADNGAQFRAVISNSLGSVTSQNVLLKVDNNLAPVPTIILPTVGSTYIAGSTLIFSGSATDDEDGPLPPEALTWEIIFHHDTHTHPGMAPTSGISGGTFELANREPASNVWYRVYLTATDSDGEETTIYRDVFPVLSNVTLATNSAGLKLDLDGTELSSPVTFTGVAGVIRDIAAPAIQVLNGITYQFVSWSDGGSPDHEIVTPTTSQTFSAYYLPLFLEAENATMSGAVMKFGSAGFSGLGYVDFVNASGDYVEWTFNVPATANYKLDFRYGNGTTKDRPLNLSVNGAIVETNKSFPPTGLWTDWSIVSSTLMLNIGTNTVRLTTNGANGGNIDYLLVSPTGPVIPSVSAPVFNPASGTFTGSQLVTITTSTSGAAIYYTTDGSSPTTSSLNYIGTFTVSSTATIKAIAVKSGMNDSPTSNATYIINPNPNFSTMLEAEDATLSGALKKYTYAGFTGTGYGDYTNNSNDFIQWSVNVPSAGQYTLAFRYANGTTKDRPLQININGITTEASKSFPSTTLWTNWSEVSSTVSLNAGINTIRATCIGSSGGNIDHLTISSVGSVTPTASAPVFTPSSGSYAAPLSISISASTAGSTIYYTLDGTTPTSTSLVYSSPIVISSSATIKAFAKASGYNDSPVASSLYTVTPPPFSTILEAENATRVGVLVKYAYAGFTGTGYGDYIVDTGEYIEWIVNAPYTGSFILDFRYANGTTKDRPLDIAVNGSIIEAAKSFPSTGLWTTWGSISTAVNLVAGNNTIRATSIGKSGANIDNIKVSNTALLTARTSTSEENLIDIEEDEASKEAEVFPIPTREILTVKSKLKLQIMGVETLDGTSLKAYYNRKTDYEWEVNLSTINNGLYILNLQAGNHNIKKKIIVEK